MEEFKNILNSKTFIIAIRVIGSLYLIVIIVNTVYAYGEYMYKTFLGSGLCGIIALGMTEYKGIGKKDINIGYIDLLKEKSIAISLATYTGTKNIIDSNTLANANELLLNAMERNTHKKTDVKNIEVNSVSEEDNNIIIITKVAEGSDPTITLFHEFTLMIVYVGNWGLPEKRKE